MLSDVEMPTSEDRTDKPPLENGAVDGDDEIATALSQTDNWLRRIPVPVGTKLVLVRVEDITWFEAQGKYVRAYAETTSYLIRQTMQVLEARLDPDRFLRVSRSAILNIDHISHLERWSLRQWSFTMRGGHKVRSTEGYRASVQRVLRGD